MEIYNKIILEMSAIYFEGFSEKEIEGIEKSLEMILGNLESREK